jgi:hypothetical protein
MRRLLVLFLLLGLGAATLLRFHQRGDLPLEWVQDPHPVSVVCLNLQGIVDSWGYDVRWVAGIAWILYLIILSFNRTLRSKIRERRTRSIPDRPHRKGGWRAAFFLLTLVAGLFYLGASLKTREFEWMGWTFNLGSQKDFTDWTGDIFFFVATAHLALFLAIHLAVETWSRSRSKNR